MPDVFANSVLQLGSLYALLALSVCISFRFLSFPDLGIDGSFVLGGAASALLLVGGWHWSAAACLALVFGFTTGVFTSFLHMVLRINRFFCGIITAMILFSINLRIIGGANQGLPSIDTYFSSAGQSDFGRSILCLSTTAVVSLIVFVTFHSYYGLRLRGFGSNSLALDISNRAKWRLLAIGLGISNAIAALAGSLITQYQSFVDVNMGLGIAINGFASLFLGESVILAVVSIVALLPRLALLSSAAYAGAWPVRGELLASLAGAYALIAISTATLYTGLNPTDLKMVAAVLLVVAILLRGRRGSYLLVPPSRYEV
jgi:putative ABC transport system permease protein